MHDQTEQAARDRKIESVLKFGLTAFYLGLGGISLIARQGEPLAPSWLSDLKALMFGIYLSPLPS